MLRIRGDVFREESDIYFSVFNLVLQTHTMEEGVGRKLLFKLIRPP